VAGAALADCSAVAGAVVADDALVVAPPEETEATGASLLALDPLAASAAAGAGAAAVGGLVELSDDFCVLRPKPRITAAMMTATTAKPSQRERFTEPRNRPVIRRQSYYAGL